MRVSEYTRSHVPTHLGRSSEQKDIPKPPTNRPHHSRSRRNSNITISQHPTMVLRIRLARFGKKHSPFYNIVVAHARYVSQFHPTIPSRESTNTATSTYPYRNAYSAFQFPK